MDQRSLSQYLTPKIWVNHRNLWFYGSLHGQKYILSPPSWLMEWLKCSNILRNLDTWSPVILSQLIGPHGNFPFSTCHNLHMILSMFFLIFFPVKTERVIPGVNSRICGALFERLQQCRHLFSAILCYWLIIGHWRFLSQSIHPDILMPTSPGLWHAL